MVLDVLGTVFEAAETLGRVGHKQVLNKALRLLLKVARKFHFPLQNLLVNGHRIVVVEWIYSR